MPIDILMPALSPTMEVGTLSKWLVKEGDSVAPGDIIAEIETDKATMEVESVDEGTVGKILVAEGTADVPVNQKIAVLLEEGEDASAAEAASAPAPAAKPAEPAEAATAKEEPKSEPAPAASAPAPGSQAPKANGHDAGERVFASPLARRLAREQGLDLSAIAGSGPHGRVVKRDVEDAVSSGTGKAAPSATAAPQAASPAPAAPVQAPSDDKIRALFKDGTYEVVPHDNMRKVIARRLTEAKSTIPHFYLSVDITLDALLKLRGDLNAAAPVAESKPAYKLSVNDFVIKALALSLKAVPEANVSWTEGGMLMHKVVDVGVAVAIPGCRRSF